MRKLSVLLASLALVSVVAVGCGGGTDTNKGMSPESSQGSTTPGTGSGG